MAMELTNEWLAQAAADSRVRGGVSTVFLDVLTSRLHATMHYQEARKVAEQMVEECLLRD